MAHPQHLTIAHMPKLESFDNSESYYATLFHELTHATGAKARTNRHTITQSDCNFGSVNYSKEELVAEFGASYLCGITGILNTTIDNSASYLKSWVERLKSDSTLLIQAGSLAQKAVDYILNVKSESDPEA